MAAPPKTKYHPNQRMRKLNDRVVTPVLYNGRAAGHGKYFAGMVDNVMIEEDGRPVPFKEIGELVKI